MPASTTNRHCQETNARGEPCGAPPLKGGDFCWHHDPTVADRRTLAKSKGGKARHGRQIGPTKPSSHADIASELVGRVRIETPADVLALLEVAAADALAMERSLSRSRCLAYVASKAADALGWIDLEARIAALEQGGRYEP